MRRIVLTVACLVVLSAIALGGAAAVLAQGTSTSAGDNQYVDPLTSTTSTSHPSGSSSSSSSSGSSGSGSSSSTSNSSISQTPSSVASGTSTSSGSSAGGTTSTAHSGTLPFTGMNVWACVAIGLGLVGTGLVLRRTARGH